MKRPVMFAAALILAASWTCGAGLFGPEGHPDPVVLAAEAEGRSRETVAAIDAASHERCAYILAAGIAAAGLCIVLGQVWPSEGLEFGPYEVTLTGCPSWERHGMDQTNDFRTRLLGGAAEILQRLKGHEVMPLGDGRGDLEGRKV